MKEPKKKERKLIAVDETIIRVGDWKVFVWAAIDVETKECLAIWVSMARHQFLVSKFIRIVLKYCKNKPTFIVDRGRWYKNAFEIFTKMRNLEKEIASNNSFQSLNQELKDSTTDSLKTKSNSDLL